MRTAQTRPRFTVSVNAGYCKGCNICVQMCPLDVLALDHRKKAVVLHGSACSGCMQCEIYCPDFAIAVEVVTAGV